MRKLAFAAAVVMATAGMGTTGQPHSYGHDGTLIPAVEIVIEHGGGCRKSSSPGQCCHAGSKPLHCH